MKTTIHESEWAALVAEHGDRQPKHPNAKTRLELSTLFNVPISTVGNQNWPERNGMKSLGKDWRKTEYGRIILVEVYEPAKRKRV